MEDLKVYAVLSCGLTEVPENIKRRAQAVGARLRDLGWILSAAGTQNVCEQFVQASDGRNMVWHPFSSADRRPHLKVGASIYVGESPEAYREVQLINPYSSQIKASAWPFVCAEWHTVAGMARSWPAARLVLQYQPEDVAYVRVGVRVARKLNLRVVNLAHDRAPWQIKDALDAMV